MGLQCSILGHSFESAGVEREREERDSEMVTTEREIERCRRCGTERVVSESTEVTAIVDGEAVGLETEAETAEGGRSSDDPEPRADTGPVTGSTSEADPTSTSDEEETGGAFAAIVDRSGVADDADDTAEETSPPDGTPSTDTGGEILDDDPDPDTPSPDADASDPSAAVGEDDPLEDDRDPAEEDAEILTDDGSERDLGEWPEESDSPGTMEGQEPDSDLDNGDAAAKESDPAVDSTPDESLSGITVPDGEIVCSDCGFRVEARSGYRAGDPCPECGAWLEAERNQ